jgi:type I restriction enzyme, S subunit
MNWPSAPLGSLCEVIAGGTPKRSHPENYTGTIPWVKISDMLNSPITATEETITETGLSNSAAKLLPSGTLLISIFATIGRTARLGTKAATNQAIVGVIPKEKDVLSLEFLHRYLDHSVGELMSKGRGVAQNNINGKILKELDILLPPLPEQKRIAAILDKADAIRRKRQETLTLTESLIQSTFLDMFGDPVASKKKWPTVELGSTTVLDAPMVDPKKEEYHDLIHLGPDRIEKETGRILPALTAKEERLISGKFLFDAEYVLYSKIRPYLRKVALPDFRGLCSADMYPVKPVKELMTREYLYSLLISLNFLHYTKRLPTRASIPKLNRSELAAYKFRLPPFNLQEKFSKIFKAINRFKVSSTNHHSESDNLFNSLQQRAFRGELSLN